MSTSRWILPSREILEAIKEGREESAEEIESLRQEIEVLKSRLKSALADKDGYGLDGDPDFVEPLGRWDS